MKNLFQFSVTIVLLVATPLFAQSLADPTKPRFLSQGSAKNIAQSKAKWRLESLIHHNGHYKAIISGAIYQQGELLGDYVVAKISQRAVYLTRGNEQLKLELYPHEIKR